ncbi:MAG: N-acetylmuramoyl-L-alanine amidase [Trueperaceae bacterium]|nr:N-acetylmuramoyl-L-alanine amidase [Trueperaceae bacterium]MCO5174462.1 N-acetylmuramoyl-L-alanine amidase [Trueperaceae bacterium]MCW5819831.1 N-acetylmuramoyl-L-alanine amidase [Trueperaceae bacterium]
MSSARSARIGRLLGACLLLWVVTLAFAEPRLLVNGRDIAANTTELVKGTSYAPGAALARALGAELTSDLGRGIVSLQVGGRVMQLALVGEPPAAGAVTESVWLDGRAVAGGPAVMTGGEVFLPVKAVAEALGASVTYLADEDTVMVVQPRARLTAMRAQARGGERVELSLSALVRYSTFFNEPLSTLHVYLERTDVETRLPTLEGEAFTTTTATATSGATEVRIQLRPGTDYRVYAVPDGRGFRLNVALGVAVGETESDKVYVVLDPGHGGSDQGIVTPGFGSEAALTLAFAERLSAGLTARGMRVALTRDLDALVDQAERERLGIGADLFISIHVAPVELGEFRAYYLGAAANATSLDMAVRENATAALREGATDTLRRELLLGLVPDLDVGRRVSEALAGRLFAVGGYRAEVVASAPLQVLGGAAGRGVLLEFSAADLASDGLPERFADAVEQLAREGGIGAAR